MKKPHNKLWGIIPQILIWGILLTIPALADTSEVFRVEIQNAKNGAIRFSQNGGISWETIGKVLLPSGKLNDAGFTASLWTNSGEVAATSVNAIHIRASGRKTIFSIVPIEFLSPKVNSRSYFSDSASIYTDIPAGKKLFGGELAPFIGNPVYINGVQLKDSLKAGDTITIAVGRPQSWPRQIVFENKFGGKITVNYQNGSTEVIGDVLRPVQGVGRFEGSLFLPPGRIRANHPGVIDISTSTSGKLGGFQIIPAFHAQSPEMSYARIKTQWMVVSNKEGSPPLFRQFLKPQYDADDIDSPDWYNRFLRRFLVDVQLKGEKGWRPMPIYGLRPGEDLQDEANSYLKDVEKIRILFPQ